MSISTKELDFENLIEAHLLETGYTKGNPQDFDRVVGLDTTTLFLFLQESQPLEWKKLEDKHGAKAKENFLKRLTKELDSKGLLRLLRHGVVDAPAKFSLCYFPPASTMNQTVVENYHKNIMTITRQVHYSQKNENSIDVVLFVNGFPFATCELKNQMTGQTVINAMNQYKFDRDHREVLLGFNKRCLVHFAVDTDEVWMTTELKGKDTYFLPFNKGYNGGKGNPVNEDGGCRTAYLWEEVLQKDSILDIIGRFIHLDEEKNRLVFPRYHQLDVVRSLISDVREFGSGKNYLIQHSAGSGKSNSIAWLSHHLSNLHDDKNNIVFNSTIVITDRKILDKQLQDTIFQFEHVDGVVTKVDTHSSQLAEALNKGRKIIITTLQKFPFILENVKDLSGKRFAVIIDEAHSSQSGEASKKMKAILGENPDLSHEERLQQIAEEEAQEEEKQVDYEDEIEREMSTHGKLPNLSFFAFTATPKPKTLETFGIKDENGKPQAFHVYSMKQAIEEEFIHDVLKHYITYKTYYQIGKSIADDPRYEKSKANKALGKFLSLNAYSLAQKTQIMIEHFRTVTKDKIGGRAKAMLVTSSRLHAVRYYHAFQEYIQKNNYEKELGVLIAFSGTIVDKEQELTEVNMNQIQEKEVPKKFHGDDYQVMIVAEKYQTGFDEPLLHTMFVDKKLSGVKAVQTLSRVNRTYVTPTISKVDTCVIDFVNSAEDIKEAFEPFYTQTSIDETTDCNIVYDLKSKLDEFRIFQDSEVEAFAKVFFKPSKRQGNMDFSKLNKYIDPAIDRYKEKEVAVQEDFKSTLQKFNRMYAFLSNIVRLDDKDMHKFFAFAKLLARKLPRNEVSPQLYLDEEVSIQRYRNQKIFEGSIELEGGEVLNNTVHAGKRKDQDEILPLSELVKKLNDMFNTQFTEEDVLVVEQLFHDLTKDEDLRAKAQSNSYDRFQHPCDEVLLNFVIDRMEKNQKFSTQMLDNETFAKTIKEVLFPAVYDWFKNNPDL